MLIIYTDGACSGNPGPGGWAAIIVENETKNEIVVSGNKKFTTNNHMELLAVLQGLFMLPRPAKLTIITDSKYVEESFNKGWYEKWIENSEFDRPNFELWRMLYNLKDIHDITIEWVKGHAGHEYNERCDELATREANKIAGLPLIVVDEKSKKESKKNKELKLPFEHLGAFEDVGPFEDVTPVPFEGVDNNAPPFEDFDLNEVDIDNTENINTPPPIEIPVSNNTINKDNGEPSNKKRSKPSKKTGKSKKAYYAVAKGRKVGIFRTWNECKKQVNKYKGGKFKKFDNSEEAEEFLRLYG